MPGTDRSSAAIAWRRNASLSFGSNAVETRYEGGGWAFLAERGRSDAR
jgi:hypothetical protein